MRLFHQHSLFPLVQFHREPNLHQAAALPFELHPHNNKMRLSTDAQLHAQPLLAGATLPQL
jgi:hypothetical protein